MDGNGIEKNSAMEFASERKVFSTLSTWFSSSFSRRARGDVTEDDTAEFCVLMLRPERQRFLSCAVLAAAARLVVVVVEKVQKDRDDDDDDDQGDDILLLDALSRRRRPSSVVSLSLSLSVCVCACVCVCVCVMK